MDTGEGRFEQFDSDDKEGFYKQLQEIENKYPKHKGVFIVGEELEIKGSRFRVKDISPFGMKLKLLES